jgi:hypothetical protein
MIHPDLASLNSHWDSAKYAAWYWARFTAIHTSTTAHHCWQVGWDDPDTEVLDLARHNQAIAEGGPTPKRADCSSTPVAMRESTASL